MNLAECGCCFFEMYARVRAYYAQLNDCEEHPCDINYLVLSISRVLRNILGERLSHTASLHALHYTYYIHVSRGCAHFVTNPCYAPQLCCSSVTLAVQHTLAFRYGLNFTAAMFVPGTSPVIRMLTEATPPLQLREL